MAAAYDEVRILLPEAETAWAESVDSLVAPGSTLIDVGAGTGRFARLFASRFDCRVIAVEPANGMRSQGVERHDPDIVWLAGRAESLPIRPATADVVWLACVVHYLDLVAQGGSWPVSCGPEDRCWSAAPSRTASMISSGSSGSLPPERSTSNGCRRWKRWRRPGLGAGSTWQTEESASILRPGISRISPNDSDIEPSRRSSSSATRSSRPG